MKGVQEKRKNDFRESKNKMSEALDALRKEIDAVDDSLHDLIMRRVCLVEQIGKVKAEEHGGMPGCSLRPAREMEIMRRLWKRHSGAMDKDVLIRLWRELISACVNIQTPLCVAVYMPERGMGNLEIARDFFGSYTAMLPCRSTGLVLKELTQGEANVGILSLNDDTQDCWWYSIAQEYKRTLSVFAKLPITGPANSRGEGKIAYAVGKIPFEPTGDDRTLLVAETDGTISLSTLDLLLKATGVPTNAICDTHTIDMARKAYLFEVDGYLSEKDDRLARVMEKENGKITMLRVIGGYPVPLS